MNFIIGTAPITEMIALHPRSAKKANTHACMELHEYLLDFHIYIITPTQTYLTIFFVNVLNTKKKDSANDY